jgi:hypothetical protein
LAKALELSQSICDRIEVQRRQEKTDHGKTNTEMDIPFMFAFRVLYNIGIIYLLVGSLQVGHNVTKKRKQETYIFFTRLAIYFRNRHHFICISYTQWIR